MPSSNTDIGYLPEILWSFFVGISGYSCPRNVVSGRGIIEKGLSDQFQRGLELRSEATRGRMNDAGALKMILWILREIASFC